MASQRRIATSPLGVGTALIAFTSLGLAALFTVQAANGSTAVAAPGPARNVAATTFKEGDDPEDHERRPKSGQISAAPRTAGAVAVSGGS